MEAGTALAIAIAAVVVLGALALVGTARTRDRERATGYLSRETRKRDRSESRFLSGARARSGREVERAAVLERRGKGAALVAVEEPPPPVEWEPPDPETIGVTRRQFMNRGIVGFFVLGLSGFGAAVLAFLWPRLGGGFGSVIRAGSLDDILASIRESREPAYFPEGRFYINPFPESAVPNAQGVYSPSLLPGMENGVVALYQKCPHLGCRVPWCKTSQWFECPCHGSQYNRVGEKKGGPAPRGMDHFPVTVEGGVVSVDTGTVILGAPIGTNTTGQEAEGPHCISIAAGGH